MAEFLSLYVFSQSYNSSSQMMEISFVFPKVVLQLKSVVSLLPIDSELLSMLIPCLPELALTAAPGASQGARAHIRR